MSSTICVGRLSTLVRDKLQEATLAFFIFVLLFVEHFVPQKPHCNADKQDHHGAHRHHQTWEVPVYCGLGNMMVVHRAWLRAEQF
eukprot:CAMPEP_0196742380 /NCGR_PEP_ID=MMETSP1091-20130531/46400_1 /TAXON_ID=302021 /ORGANISM="Rhodomonas sp., Strain CCMP768" /LENGTH=84 /DNA_ID=CAMNT_0042088405 /DNA_START=182 /DNA_END=433 /DNA_ORIENTATION=+